MKKYRLILLLVFALPFLSLENYYVFSSGISFVSAPQPAKTPLTAQSTEALLASQSAEVPLAVQSTNASYASQSIKAPPAESAPIVLSPSPMPEDSPSPAPTPNINTEPGSDTEPEASPSPDPTPEDSPSPASTPDTDAEIVYPINSYKDTNNIYLTFDDGGNKKSIEKALEVLKQNDVKCTFFVVGKYLRSYPELWKQAIEDGHQICNHTQNHEWLYELSNEGIKKEILEWETTAAEVLGKDYIENMKQEYPYLRIPYNAGGNSKRVLRIIAELGYIPIGWNLETYYAVLRHHDLSTEPVKPIAAEVAAHVTKRVKGGSIILLHFNAYDTYNLDEIISSIKEKGFTLKLLSEHDS